MTNRVVAARIGRRFGPGPRQGLPVLDSIPPGADDTVHGAGPCAASCGELQVKNMMGLCAGYPGQRVTVLVLHGHLRACTQGRRFQLGGRRSTLSWNPAWPVAAWAMGMGWSEAGYALLTFVIVLALAVGLWMPGFIGGGDAKLIAAVALWFAWPGVLIFALWSVIAGGALAVLLLALRRIAPALPLQPEWVARSPLADGAPAPYAVALAAGALIALPQTTLIAAFGP